ncbi:hypothetical protein CC2G_004434 [Coprinopsis cinerea AmutBmut pab1-1]|nr:hypothetical protein CC2G_004434 [Coprinopsis cinerea AmutBmut pab1-1]
MPPNMPSPRFGLVSTTLALGALLFGAARAAIPTPLPTAVDPTPSPLVPLGGQCGGITYKGPTGCAQIPGKTVACVVVDPYLHQCQIIEPTARPTKTTKPTSTCLTSTLACSASCRISCPRGQHLTGTACPFCKCETPTPLCSATSIRPPPHVITSTILPPPPGTITPAPTSSDVTTCVTSTVHCVTNCLIACPPGLVLTGSRCPWCTCAKPTPLCTGTATP